jgi:putative DNA primase/helicase
MYFDRKGVVGVTAYPTARLILATNNEPRFADRSKGIWRRMIVIPFNVSIPKDRQDPQLAAKIKAEELPGIFNWGIEGLRELRRNRRFTIPAVSQQAWEDFRRESNPASEFLVENYAASSDRDAVPCAEMFAEYGEWCRARGLKALDVQKFGKELKKALPKVDRRRETTGKRPWNYHGLTRVASSTCDLTEDAGCGPVIVEL